MTLVVFDVDALESWKRQLREAANAGAACNEQVLACLNSLEQLGRTMKHDSIPPVSSNDLESHLAAISPASSPRVTASTQVWTVRTINYTHHVLNKMKRERQVQRLTQRLGKMAAELHSVAQDMWKVLKVSGIHHATTASQRFGDEKAVGTPDRVRSVATGPGSTDNASPVLSSSTCRTLRSFFGRFPDFDAYLLLRCSTLNASSESTKATSTTPSCVKNQVDASVQTPLKFLAEAVSSDAPRERLPFLCRRCRQDGRDDYQIDKNRMQLMRANDTAVASGRTELQRPLRRGLLRYAAGPDTQYTLPRIHNTQKPRY